MYSISELLKIAIIAAVTFGRWNVSMQIAIRLSSHEYRKTVLRSKDSNQCGFASILGEEQ